MICPTAPPTPTPKPEPKTAFYFTREPFGSSAPWGFREDREYGATCSQGYHRNRYVVVEEEKSGSAGCYFNNWVSDDEKMCKINVHFWTDGFSGLKCNIQIFEIGDIQPAPPTPPCPCW
jgi:hypothetical protein